MRLIPCNSNFYKQWFGDLDVQHRVIHKNGLSFYLVATSDLGAQARRFEVHSGHSKTL